ncbi:hypothetical protein ACFQV2_01775 [Actinokineospora soli]|uniref:Uncharacterized protein n=1 Tax=Actinokineospora soli TaxID=1048753 RepID=A0ABW2TFU0_9PSEU
MDDPADRALAAALAGWLTALLAGAGADLRPDQAVLADAVHRTLPALFHHRVFPERHADLTARLRAVFSVDPPRLGPTADAADLRAAVTAAVVPLTSDPFYRFPMHDLPDVVLRIAHDAVSRLAALTGVACPPAALARLGFTDHAAALSNAITGTVHGPVVQAGVVHGDVTLVVGEKEPDIPLVTTVQTKLAHGYRTSRGRVGLTGSTSIAITVEALVARAVILTALRPVVLRRATPDPGPGWVALGTLTPAPSPPT